MRRVFVLLFLLVPQSVLACAVCVGNNDKSATAFLIATVFLTALPVAVILGSIRWAQNKMAEREREAQLQYVPVSTNQDPRGSNRISASNTFPG